MELNAVMQTLEQMGTEQNRKVYQRHGVGANLFGVSYANLETLRKRIKKDLPLARQLWATGVHDARILATKIADPMEVDQALLIQWTQELDNYALTDAVVDLAAKTPFARRLAEQWIASQAEYLSRAGWHLLAQIALNDDSLPDSFFVPYLAQITAEIHLRPNRARQGMHNALLAIGARSDSLETLSIASADKIGPVHIDHGETHCKTPDTIPYIRKARAHRKGKGK